MPYPSSQRNHMSSFKIQSALDSWIKTYEKSPEPNTCENENFGTSVIGVGPGPGREPDGPKASKARSTGAEPQACVDSASQFNSYAFLIPSSMTVAIARYHAILSSNWCSYSVCAFNFLCIWFLSLNFDWFVLGLWALKTGLRSSSKAVCQDD